MTLILTSNIIYILNNYTVSWFRLHATEVALVRGVLQVMVFGVVLLLGNRKLGKLKNDNKEGFIFLKSNISLNLQLNREHQVRPHHNLSVARDLPLRSLDVRRGPDLPCRHPSHAHRGPHRPLLHLPRLRHRV